MKKNLIITRLSSRGQVVIPKEVRKQVGWEPSDYVTVGVRDDAVVMRCLKLDKMPAGSISWKRCLPLTP